MADPTAPLDPVKRVTRSKAQARNSYNRLSRWYDLLSMGAEEKVKQAGLQTLDAQPGETVLEIGFGTGHCLAPLARAVGETGKAAGLDLSTGMCRAAQTRLRHKNLLHLVPLTCGDAASLPFRQQTFDALFASFTLELFDTHEISLVLAEWTRVLRPNGRLCVVSLAHLDPKSWIVRLYEKAHEKLPNWIDCRPIRVCDEIEQAGYLVASVSTYKMFGLPVQIVLAQSTLSTPDLLNRRID